MSHFIMVSISLAFKILRKKSVGFFAFVFDKNVFNIDKHRALFNKIFVDFPMFLTCSFNRQGLVTTDDSGEESDSGNLQIVSN